MDAFESLVSRLLGSEGYWVKPNFRVELTKQEKMEIGRPTTPRWELDLVAYSGAENKILAVECKSWLDGIGLTLPSLTDPIHRHKKSLKLFREPVTRKVVFKRLVKQLRESGSVAPRPSVTLCLAVGKIARDRKEIHSYFKKKRWLLFDEDWLKGKLETVSKGGWENTEVAIVAKVLLRGKEGKK